MIEIRKSKREENLLKKRREGFKFPNASPAAQEKLESLPAMIAGVQSSDAILQLEATTQFGKLLSIEKIESLNGEDVVGARGFGTVYRMVMNDCGTFAVKRIDRSREASDQGFERELEILSSVKDINLVNLRGYCRLPTAKLLIYDYLAMGSLNDFLHESFPRKDQKENPSIPCFLFGHSTGGSVVLKAASYPSIEKMLEGWNVDDRL